MTKLKDPPPAEKLEPSFHRFVSSLHWKRSAGSVAVNVNVAVRFVVSAGGPEVIFVFGGGLTVHV